MSPKENIVVHSTSSYDHGLDVLGCRGASVDMLGAGFFSNLLSSKPKPALRAGFVMKTSPAGGKYTAFVANKTKPGDHATSLKNAKEAGQRAVSIAAKLLKAIKAAPKTTARVTTVRGMVVPVASTRTTLHAPTSRAAKVGHPRMTVAQLTKIAQSAQKAGKDLLAHAAKYGAMVQASNGKTIAGQKAAASKLSKVFGTPAAAPATKSATKKPAAKSTKVHGDAYQVMHDIFGAYLHILGADASGFMPGQAGYDPTTDQTSGGTAGVVPGVVTPTGTGVGPDANGLMPGTTGYDPTTDPTSPQYGLTAGATGTTGAGLPDVNGNMPGSPDFDPTTAGPQYGFGPPPTAASVALIPGQDYAPDPNGPNATPPGAGDPWNDPVVYTLGTMPLGYILFTNVPDLGSVGHADNNAMHGHTSIGSANRFRYNVPNFTNPTAIPKEGKNSGFDFSGDGWQKYVHNSKGSGFSAPSGSEMQDLNQASASRGWGPIVGLPNSPFQGLRYITGAAPPPVDPVTGKPSTTVMQTSNAGWPTATLFYYYDTAPPALQQPILLLRLNQAIADYKTNVTSAAANAAAAAAQDQLDAQQAAAQAKQQALQDAQDAHQQASDLQAQQAQAAQQDVADQQAQGSQTAAAQSQAAAQAQQADAESQRQQAQDEHDEQMAEQAADAKAKRDQDELSNALAMDQQNAAAQADQDQQAQLAQNLQQGQAQQAQQTLLPPDRGTGNQSNRGQTYTDDGVQNYADDADGGDQMMNVDQAQDSELPTADEAMDQPDSEVLGAMTTAQRARLKRYLASLGKTILSGEDDPFGRVSGAQRIRDRRADRD